MQHDYAIAEKPWELTIGVDRDDIETDNLGIYNPMFQEMGRADQGAARPAGVCAAGRRLFDALLRRPVLLRHRPSGARCGGRRAFDFEHWRRLGLALVPAVRRCP